MKFRALSYTKKNRFDYPVWRVFMTFICNLSRQEWPEDAQARFFRFRIYPFAVLLGYKNYYTWDRVK